jgi:hypothetical protein
MSDVTTYNFEVNVLLLQEYGTWIAQGLDYDITGHGADITAAIENFGRTFLGQAIVDITHGEKPLVTVKRAPRFYWQRFDEAKWRGEEKRFQVLPEENLPAFMINALAADMRIYTS